MSVRHRVSRLLAAGAAGLAMLLPLSVVSSSPAHATNGTCNGASTRYNGIQGVYAWIPLNSGDKTCWMGQGHGTTAAQKKAVRALQNNILDCYGSTWAGDKISRSGGADGVYGEATKAAVRWLQANELGLSGSNVDGVYGAQTRGRMMWLEVSSDNIPLIYPGGRRCTNSSQI